MDIHAASAIAPCITHGKALAHIAGGLTDPVLGKISNKKVQLCPQHSGFLSHEKIEGYMELYPETEFRLHASPKLAKTKRGIVYASNIDQSEEYIKTMLSLTKLMGSSAYSIHAGEREQSSVAGAVEQAKRLQDRTETRIAIEGLYPAARNKWLISSWAEYEELANSGFGFALDLSHLNIVVHKEGRQDALVADMMASANCVEIHVSHNNGRIDSHMPIPNDQKPWWYDMMLQAHCETDIFYEGVLVRPVGDNR